MSSCIIADSKTSNALNEHSDNVSRNTGTVITKSYMQFYGAVNNFKSW